MSDPFFCFVTIDLHLFNCELDVDHKLTKFNVLSCESTTTRQRVDKSRQQLDNDSTKVDNESTTSQQNLTRSLTSREFEHW